MLCRGNGFVSTADSKQTDLEQRERGFKIQNANPAAELSRVMKSPRQDMHMSTVFV